MSRSKKWRLEWAFFLGENGRRKYNKVCKGCAHPCKQSFRAVLIACPHYQSARSKRGCDVGSKWREKSRVAAFPGWSFRCIRWACPSDLMGADRLF